MDPVFSQIALTLLICAFGIWISVVDFREHRIPDAASLPLLAVGLGLSGYATQIALADRLIGMGLGFLLFWLIGALYFRRHGQEALGLGDAKLFAAAGAWLGWSALPIVLLLATLMGLAFAILRGRRETRGLAFGPWLMGGFILRWLHLLLFR